MATYIVTLDNWNDPDFWAAIEPEGDGHTLDFSALPEPFAIYYYADSGMFAMLLGAESFSVGDATYGDGDAQLGGATRLTQFDTVYGSQGFDLIYGTDGDEQLFGSRGDNWILAGGGDDVVATSSGNDIIAAGEGDDVVFAGAGTNLVSLGDGNDTFNSNDAEAGDDFVEGGDGNDTIAAGAGRDNVAGGRGDDILDGGAGQDALSGGAGDDTITGGSGNDTIHGDGSLNKTVAETDFESGIPAWFTTPGGAPVTAHGTFNDGTRFLGPVAGDTSATETVRATVDLEPDAPHAVVTFDFIRFDGWDDSEAFGLDERFHVFLDGVSIFSYKPGYMYTDGSSATGAFDGGTWSIRPAGPSQHLGNNVDVSDQRYEVRIVFDNPGDALRIGFGAQLNQPAFDEAWGIDNFRVVSTDDPGDGSGADDIDAGTDADLVFAGRGDDIIAGGDGDDTIFGDGVVVETNAQDDFSIGVPDWIEPYGDTPPLSTSELNDGNSFLGPVGGNATGSEQVRATVDLSDEATRAVIEFDFLRLDSWDNERMFVYLDGAPVHEFNPNLGTYPLTTSIPGGRITISASASGALGGNSGYWDRIVAVRIVLDDPPPTVRLGIGARLDSGVADESWGIDNFRVMSVAEAEEGGADTISGGAGRDAIYGGAGDDTIDGGAGDDRIDGGSGSDRITTGAGRDIVVVARGAGTDVITDFDYAAAGDGYLMDRLDISALRGGSGPDGTVLWRDIAVDQTTDGDAVLTFPEGERLILMGVPSAQAATRQDARAAGIPCFTAGTMILTPCGEIPVERLRPGDLVTTRDNGPQPLLWLASRRLGAAELATAPSLRPVRIAAGAFSNDRTLLVSPQHCIALHRPERGGGEAFARAIQLARLRGGKVRVAEGVRSVTYVHLFFARHQVVFSNGIATESFFPGERAVGGLGTRQREEFRRLFGDLVGPTAADYGPPARELLRRPDLPRHLGALSLPPA